jgi:hypothetical protein
MGHGYFSLPERSELASLEVSDAATARVGPLLRATDRRWPGHSRSAGAAVASGWPAPRALAVQEE